MKPRKFIIFDGISGSGKTTLEDMYRKHNNYYDYTQHRFTPSKWVYGKMYKRYTENDNIEIFEDEILIQRMFPTFYIYLRCDNKVALRRKLEQRDENLEDLYTAYTIFEDYKRVSQYKNILVVETSTETALQCLRRIVEFVK